ncbi:hypothetical protein GCM10023169_18920 [Georgenia halophila]|uniref:DUF3784 domain-containing protein n=1 Tax=Georgenia halophila TaxID=620889 RepID=A0ABP8L737_9MICO
MLVGILLVLCGSALFTWSAVEMSHANPTVAFPLWKDPPRRPWKALGLRAGGAALAVLGAGLAGDTIGYWSVLLIVAAFGGIPLIYVIHNRRLTTTARAS